MLPAKKGKRRLVSKDGETDSDGIFEILAYGDEGSGRDGGLDGG